MREFAAALLVNVLADLERPETRAALLAALRSEKPAQDAVRTYLGSVETSADVAPLAFMGDFLREQVLYAKARK